MTEEQKLVKEFKCLNSGKSIEAYVYKDHSMIVLSTHTTKGVVVKVETVRLDMDVAFDLADFINQYRQQPTAYPDNRRCKVCNGTGVNGVVCMKCGGTGWNPLGKS